MKRLILCLVLCIPAVVCAQSITQPEDNTAFMNSVIIKICNSMETVGANVVEAKNKGISQQSIEEQQQASVDKTAQGIPMPMTNVITGITDMIFQKDVKDPNKGRWLANKYCRQYLLNVATQQGAYN